MIRYVCHHLGCPYHSPNRELVEQHVVKPHVRCACCGRHFARGMSLIQHRSWVKDRAARAFATGEATRRRLAKRKVIV